MSPRIKQSLDLLDRQKTMIMERVTALDEERQRKPMNPRVWTPLQIVAHLVLMEREYLNYLAEGEKQNVAAKKASKHPALFLLTWTMQKRISIPTLEKLEPPATPLPAEEMGQEWDKTRALLTRYLGNVSEMAEEKPVALHPQLGPLNALQILSLLTAHQEYHLDQIPRS